MIQNNALLDYIVRDLAEKGQYELSLQLQHQQMIERLNQQRDRENLKNEIIEEVLSRISVMFENGEAIEKIKALNNAIEELAR